MHLHSLSRNEHVRVRVGLPDADRPSLPSVTDVWPAANWFEREAFDLYGFDFPGHPNLQRILCHDAFVGHALRKDYAPGQRWFFAEEDLRMPEWSKETDVRAGHFETQTISIGPSHPATHGIIHLVARLDGERIVRAETMIGYLHRCFEKMAEKHHWNQVVPYCDRLNYVSSMINGVGYVRTVEKMLGIEVPDRGRLVRTILSEFSRIMDHCVCIGANLVDIGALTNFWYLYQNRENIYGLLEACCGARLTVSYVRVGGLAIDVPDDFVARSRGAARVDPEADRRHREAHHQQPDRPQPPRGHRHRHEGAGDRLGDDRTDAAGVGRAVRRAAFPAVRLLRPVRLGRSHRAGRRQLRPLPRPPRGDAAVARRSSARPSTCSRRPEPVNSDDWRVVLPPKDAVYHDMESLIYHFKLTMEGIRVPAGERYEWIEGANGELGFYAVSDGRGGPYRLKVRPPCFPNLAAFEHIVVGGTISDAVATLGTLNVIAGELDR